MVHVIVFSKDRAFQLSQYVRTLRESSIFSALAHTPVPMCFTPSVLPLFPTPLLRGWGRAGA
jgi:hypothetical protein